MTYLLMVVAATMILAALVRRMRLSPGRLHPADGRASEAAGARANGLAADAVGEMMAAKHKLGTS